MPKARVGGEHERGHSPFRKGGSGDLPRENFIFPDVRRDDFNALCEHERGHSPSRKGGSGDLPRENFIFPDVRRDDFNALCDNFCP